MADAGVGYRFPRIGAAKDLTVRFNVNNLFDASYIGPIGTGGFSLSSDLQTLQAAPRRLMFLSLGTRFLSSLILGGCPARVLVCAPPIWRADEPND